MLWGGRFKKEFDKAALEFSSSLSFDINLLLQDLQVSRAHAAMLGKTGIIPENEAGQIIGGLNQIELQWNEGLWKPDPAKFEDIHSAVEHRLTELIGTAAAKLHSGRSRNDQVAADMRLWIKSACDNISEKIISLQKQFLKTAEENINTIIPGYTHLQRAQPISFAFHLLAYVEMLERDKKRISFTRQLADVSPLGAGALAGSTLPLDRNFTAEALGFSSVSGNALDSVSDRDFLLDFLNSCAVGMMHLSRLSEEIILWSSSEWRFVKLSDQHTTGSSLMPQKKNPDLAELIRGKSGRVNGNYISLITTMKGLPLSYNRDLQEDKEPVFDSYNTYLNSLILAEAMLSGMEINKDRFSKELKEDYSLSTDLADWLVLKGIPFREAHHIVGGLVLYSEERGIPFSSLTIQDLKEVNEIFDPSVLACLDINTSLHRKKTHGSPNPDLVKEQIHFWEKELIS